MFKNLEQLIKVIRERKNSSPDKSYTNKLLNDKNLSVAKVKEEIGELIEAVEQDSNKIHEAADVIYHLMIYLEANDIHVEYLELRSLITLEEESDKLKSCGIFIACYIDDVRLIDNIEI